MSAGKRDKRIFLEKPGIVQNEHGEEVEAWVPLDGGVEPVREWVQIYYGRGDERRQAATEQASQSATFRMLANERTRLLTTKSQILFEGVWDIHGIVPDTPVRGEMEVTAMKKA